MSDTLLHCFACDAFTPQSGDELVCSQCSSDFVEIVQVERSPGQATAGQEPRRERNEGAEDDAAPSGQPQTVPGIQGMLSSILLSIPPQPTNGQPQGRPPQHADESENMDEERQQERLAQDYVDDAQRPPFNDFFSQLFGQFPNDQASASNSNSNNFFRSRSAPDGSTFTFAFGSSAGRDHPFTDFLENAGYSTPGMNTATTHQGLPQGAPGRPVNFNRLPDLASFLTQALGVAPGTSVGDYANGEAFDNIISELMSRNPQSNVRPASDVAISQLSRIALKKGTSGKSGNLIGEECSICQDEYADKEVLVELSCHHIYHEECLLSWVKTNGVCPICRTPVLEHTPTNVTLEQEELD